MKKKNKKDLSRFIATKDELIKSFKQQKSTLQDKLKKRLQKQK